MCCPVPNRRAMPQWLAAPRTHHYGRACRNGRAISVYSRMKPASGPDSTAGPCCRGSTWPGRAPRSTRQRKALYHVRSHRRHDGSPIRRRFEPILGISVYASAKAPDISLRRADSGGYPDPGELAADRWNETNGDRVYPCLLSPTACLKPSRTRWTAAAAASPLAIVSDSLKLVENQAV